MLRQVIGRLATDKISSEKIELEGLETRAGQTAAGGLMHSSGKNSIVSGTVTEGCHF
jgi:hypothetical protein